MPCQEEGGASEALYSDCWKVITMSTNSQPGVTASTTKRAWQTPAIEDESKDFLRGAAKSVTSEPADVHGSSSATGLAS